MSHIHQQFRVDGALESINILMALLGGSGDQWSSMVVNCDKCSTDSMGPPSPVPPSLPFLDPSIVWPIYRCVGRVGSDMLGRLFPQNPISTCHLIMRPAMQSLVPGERRLILMPFFVFHWR